MNKKEICNICRRGGRKLIHYRGDVTVCKGCDWLSNDVMFHMISLFYWDRIELLNYGKKEIK